MSGTVFDVFMGDAVPLSIGGAMAAMALLTRREMLFPIIGDSMQLFGIL